jgi:MYXO-CTERM domain-containing protein
MPSAQPAPVARSSQPTIYGTDDRVDVYACTDARFRALATDSAAALMFGISLDQSDPSHIRYWSNTLQSAEGLCSDQRFLADPTAGFCSATLIDDDLVLTAGHCVTDANACANVRVVFHYYRTDATTLATATSEDVYRCSELVVQNQDHSNGHDRDYAIFRLDRPATPRHVPAAVSLDTAPLAVGTSVTCIGYPSGIPCKVDSGGHVRTSQINQGDSFLATTDTFHGNSGSGIYDTTSGLLHGILVDGDQDYVQQGGCFVAYTCPENGCSGETSVYVNVALQDFCATAASNRLCCGNGVCDRFETSIGCPMDCPISDGGTNSDAMADATLTDSAPDAHDAATNDSAALDAAAARDSGVLDSTPNEASVITVPGQVIGGCACRTGGSKGQSDGVALMASAFAALAVALTRRRRTARG